MKELGASLGVRVGTAAEAAQLSQIMADPPYLSVLKGESWVSKMGWFKNYQATYINTSKFRPIMHVIGFVLCVGYLMEYPHLRHEQHSKKRKTRRPVLQTPRKRNPPHRSER